MTRLRVFRLSFHKSLVRPILAGLVVASCLASATSADAAKPNTLTPREAQTGWRLLFDGKTTDGWRNYGKQELRDGWQVIDGALTRVDENAGDLISTEQFDSFELSLEYNISPGGNSGLMFHVVEGEAAPWMTGPEIQIQDNVDGHDPQKSGWLYQLHSTDKDATRPPGEWNEIRIRITPEGCLTYVNSVRYAQYEKGGADWNRRVAESKFAEFENFGKATRGHICLQDHGNRVAFRNIKIRPIAAGDTDQAANPVEGALPLAAELAFPELQWDGWSPVTPDGLPQPLRPIQVGHAGDGTNRLFVVTQRGVIHTFENRPDVSRTTVFLDITDQTTYRDNQFERGLLGLAFHPRYRENGEFFICYTTQGRQFDTVVSRMHVSADDPDRANPESEEVLLRFAQPYWNHNGGTILFGPDGYLYLTFGDGGKYNDPHDNGQNLANLMGKVLRIDVDRQSADQPYAIPADNPFVGQPDARGEIWAYGLRNIWRMAFDRETGRLWAADVGQDLYEEINIIERGGNYGWNRREGMHPFGARTVGPDIRLIEPIWEYDHSAGVSITGGLVYRGERIPQLAGCYLYGDFVSSKLWALRYDPESQQTSNLQIAGPSLAVTSFGEDEQGEVLLTVVAPHGKGIYRLVPNH